MGTMRDVMRSCFEPTKLNCTMMILCILFLWNATSPAHLLILGLTGDLILLGEVLAGTVAFGMVMGAASNGIKVIKNARSKANQKQIIKHLEKISKESDANPNPTKITCNHGNDPIDIGKLGQNEKIYGLKIMKQNNQFHYNCYRRGSLEQYVKATDHQQLKKSCVKDVVTKTQIGLQNIIAGVFPTEVGRKLVDLTRQLQEKLHVSWTTEENIEQESNLEKLFTFCKNFDFNVQNISGFVFVLQTCFDQSNPEQKKEIISLIQPKDSAFSPLKIQDMENGFKIFQNNSDKFDELFADDPGLAIFEKDFTTLKKCVIENGNQCCLDEMNLEFFPKLEELKLPACGKRDL